MERILYILGGLLVVGAGLTHGLVRLLMNPMPEEEEDIFWEKEDDDPSYVRYTHWLQGTLACICLGVLLLFIAVAV